MAEPFCSLPAKPEVFGVRFGSGFARFSAVLVIFCHFLPFSGPVFPRFFTIPPVKPGMNEFRGFMLFGAPKTPRNGFPG